MDEFNTRPDCRNSSLRDMLRVWLMGCVFCGLGSGCATVFSKPVTSVSQSTLPWLAGFTAPPVEAAPSFDLTQIQPTPRSGAGPDDLLEITIWDLYEPGKPHTFPARVDSHGQIVVPHLDTVAVTGLSPAQIEAKLAEAYRRQEVLKQPRLLVRELGSTPVHIYVTGAVLRPGLINLPRHEASVFATLVAAGGLSRNAGLHVHVSDQVQVRQTEPHQASITDTQPSPQVAGNSAIALHGPVISTLATIEDAAPPAPPQMDPPPTPEPRTEPVLQQLVNHSESLAVPADGKVNTPESSVSGRDADKSRIVEGIATRPATHPTAVPPSQFGRWYDLSLDRDREALKQLVLRDADVVTVRPAAPPIRITGAVAQPGAYRAPAGNALSLTEAIQLAGGMGATDLPIIVVLTRPANSEHALKRWTVRMGHGEKPPHNMPFVQPGDLIHVEPTAQARVQSLVGSLWPGK